MKKKMMSAILIVLSVLLIVSCAPEESAAGDAEPAPGAAAMNNDRNVLGSGSFRTGRAPAYAFKSSPADNKAGASRASFFNAENDYSFRDTLRVIAAKYYSKSLNKHLALYYGDSDEQTNDGRRGHRARVRTPGSIASTHS